jgi:uncharacterized protein with PIN domain
MDAQQIKLYQRIQCFSLDEADAAFPLSQKLARENGWTAQYTQRVMDEFKKFMFLAVVAGHPVTPSEQVDQVWHLYLTYTHSYWHEFCAKVLQKPLHHNPTRGGISEYQKFDKWYTNTLISYERFFDQLPPSDIWPPSAIRFGQEFRRINTQAYWLIPKPSFQGFCWRPLLPKQSMIAALFLVVALMISSISLITATTASPIYAADVVKTTSTSSNVLGGLDWLLKTLLALSAFSFSLAVIKLGYAKNLSRSPIFIPPIGRSKVNGFYSGDDIKIVQICHSAASDVWCSLLILLWTPIILLLLFLGYDYELPGHQHFAILGVMGLIGIIGLVIEALRGKLEQNSKISSWIHRYILPFQDQKKHSIHPLHCKNCRNPLEKVSLDTIQLDRPKSVAININSLEFEAWHCPCCYPKVDQNTVHLRTWEKSSEFDYCSACNERTMRVTCETLKNATEMAEGEGIKIYTCECCGRKDKRGYPISRIYPISRVYISPELSNPPNNDVGCGACGCM